MTSTLEAASAHPAHSARVSGTRPSTAAAGPHVMTIACRPIAPSAVAMRNGLLNGLTVNRERCSVRALPDWKKLMMTKRVSTRVRAWSSA